MCTRVTVVCVCVIALVPAYELHKGFQLADFAIKLSSQVIACSSLSHGQVGHFHSLRVLRLDKWSSHLKGAYIHTLQCVCMRAER